MNNETNVNVNEQVQEVVENFTGSIEPMTKKERRRKFFNETTHKVLAEERANGNIAIDRKTVRLAIRNQLSKVGKVGASQFAGLASRRDRKALAKLQGVPFIPKYNGGTITRKVWES